MFFAFFVICHLGNISLTSVRLALRNVMQESTIPVLQNYWSLICTNIYIDLSSVYDFFCFSKIKVYKKLFGPVVWKLHNEFLSYLFV